MDQKVAKNCGAMFCAEIINPVPESSVKISWYINGEKVSRDVSKRFLTKFDPKSGKCVLTIADCTLGDEGVVKCSIDNEYGGSECTSKLIIQI